MLLEKYISHLAEAKGLVGDDHLEDSLCVHSMTLEKWMLPIKIEDCSLKRTSS